jgi:hypothetical protein
MPEWFKDWWPVVIVVVGAIWAAFAYFDKRRREALAKRDDKAAGPSVTANGGSVAAGGDMSGNTITTNRSADDPGR